MTWWMWVVLISPPVIAAIFGIVDGNDWQVPVIYFLSWLFLTAIVVGLTLGTKWMLIGLPHESCRQVAAQMDRESRWNYYTGCLIQDGDRFIPLSSFVRNEESQR